MASNRMSISQSDFAVHFASSRASQSWTAHRKRKQDLEREGVQSDALRKSDLGHVGRVIKNFKYLRLYSLCNQILKQAIGQEEWLKDGEGCSP